jgi:hypothetical protein
MTSRSLSKSSKAALPSGSTAVTVVTALCGLRVEFLGTGQIVRVVGQSCWGQVKYEYEYEGQKEFLGTGQI